MSDGESRCPLSWRDRKTTGRPAISLLSSGPDGAPQGVSTRSSRAFFRAGRSYMPDPPMMPRTARVMAGSGVAGRARPNFLFGEVQQTGGDDEEDHHLQADALTRDEMRLGGPLEERGDILRIMRQVGRRPIGIFHLAIGQRRRHL